MARWIEKATGIEKVWNQRRWDYLEKSKYAWQKPRPKHKEGDHYAQENFNINWPLIVFDILQINIRERDCPKYASHHDRDINAHFKHFGCRADSVSLGRGITT